MRKKTRDWALMTCISVVLSVSLIILIPVYLAIIKHYDRDARAIPVKRLEEQLVYQGVECRVERGIYFDNDAWEFIVVGRLDRVDGSAEKAALVRNGEIYDFDHHKGSVTCVNLSRDRSLIAYSRYHSFKDMGEFLPKFREGWAKAKEDALGRSPGGE
ncbi:MAG: hypothetical protein K8R88_12180 [Armatimonadetes bacterium]|nr:hypothetical protein [Armatimonadota bacterium]